MCDVTVEKQIREILVANAKYVKSSGCCPFYSYSNRFIYLSLYYEMLLKRKFKKKQQQKNNGNGRKIKRECHHIHSLVFLTSPFHYITCHLFF